MKKLFLILIPVLFLTGCVQSHPDYSVAVSINTDENTTFQHDLKRSDLNYLQTTVSTEISGRYFLLPPTDKDFSIDDVISLDENVLAITDIDYDNHTFKALAKNTGKTKIRVIVNDTRFATSLNIVVVK